MIPNSVSVGAEAIPNSRLNIRAVRDGETTGENYQGEMSPSPTVASNSRIGKALRLFWLILKLCQVFDRCWGQGL